MTRGPYRAGTRRLRHAAAHAALGLLSACAVGPDFQRPAAPAVSAYTHEAIDLPAAAPEDAQALVSGQDIPAQWWRLFHSPALDALVAQSLRANPTLRAGQAALRVAIENYDAQRSGYFPSLQAGYSASRERDATGTLSPTLASGAPIFSLHTAQVAVSYVLDPFGGTRRQVESAAALASAQRFELEATSLTLSSNVVAAAIQEGSLRAQLAATIQIATLEQDALAILRSRYELGAMAWADVLAQQAALAQTQAAVAALEKQLAQQRDALLALCSAYPADELPQRVELDALSLPSTLPLSLPSDLVRQRPDVRAAEQQLRAANAQVGVAIANFLPQISLSADLGGAATSVSELFRPGSRYWDASGGLTQTLFAGGALLHRKRGADAALEQAAAQYQSAVIAAFQNVADTLQALQFDAAALQRQEQARQASQQQLQIVEQQLQLGSTTPLAWLNAQQSLQQSTLAWVQARANRLLDTAALFQALGGGWWNRPAPDTH